MSSEERLEAEFVAGQRVQSVNTDKKSLQVGTVKYAGPVDGYEGLWIGVDWDSGQGRHNGTVNGKHYFDATDGTSGSLVRPHTLSGGVTLFEALGRRYNSSLSLDKSEEDDMYILSTRQRRLPVELVGKRQIEARQKELHHLKVASLAYTGVSSAGPPGQFQSLVPNLTELDLTGNLLPDWLAVGKLCAELPKIEVLNLSSSRLRIPTTKMMQTFSMRILVLSNCHMTWNQVEQLKSCLSFVEELHICENKISSLEVTSEQNSSSTGEVFVEGFDSLRLLNLENNDITNWEEIMKLSKLRSLEHLNLNSNSIQKVRYPGFPPTSNSNDEGAQDKDPSSKSVHFQSLHCLLLGKNNVSDWASIDELNKFPALRDSRLSENPITNTVKGGAPRYMLIARIQKITSLNGSEIKQRERRDAEIRYVRYALSNVNGETVEELHKLHPRLTELRLSYDVPVESVQRGAGPASQTLSASLFSIKILCVASSVGERPLMTKRLPSSTTVGKLKLICEALFKVRAAKQRLFVKDQDPLPVPLDNDLESLNDVGLGADAVILVDEADGS